MNDLKNFFFNTDGKIIHKWIHYFDIYERHFQKFKGQNVTLLEVGVSHGGSLDMWKNYFGKDSLIIGIDINPECKSLEKDNIKIFIGSQSDKKFLNEVKSSIPKLDILIDDGGHTMKQQIVTYKALFDHIKPEGIYLCEDTHTSYWLDYGGGYKRKGTFIEFAKNLIDYINAFHSEQRKLKPGLFTTTVDSVHFYDSIVVVEKKPRTQSTHLIKGSISLKELNIQQSRLKYYFNTTVKIVKRQLRHLSRFFNIKSSI